MNIDRCICYGIMFKEILSRADGKGWTVDDIENILGCGGACGMCKPYIRVGLKTGQTEFDQIIRDDPSDPQP